MKIDKKIRGHAQVLHYKQGLLFGKVYVRSMGLIVMKGFSLQSGRGTMHIHSLSAGVQTSCSVGKSLKGKVNKGHLMW